MDKITILYMIDTFSGMAGAERNLFEVVTRLDTKRYAPIVICLHGGRLAHILRGNREIEVMSLDLVRIYTVNAIIKAIKIFKLIKRRKVKIVVTYHESSDFFGGIIAKLAGVPVIISSRRDMGYRLNKRHILFYRIINNLFDKIITVSDAVKDEIFRKQNVPWHKLTTIHNGVELEKFDIKVDKDALKKSLKLEKHRPVVGILAALRPIKGHKYFLEAASIILKELPDTYFLIIGWFDDENYYCKELKDFTKELGIGRNVFFTGGRLDTAEMLSIVDVAVLSSINEGFSNTMLEYMAAGKPVVGTEAGGTKEAVIHKEPGFLVPPRDAEGLASAVGLLLRDRDLRIKMGKQGRERAEAYFSITKMMRGIEGLYGDLLREKEKGRLYSKGSPKPLRIFINAVKVMISGALYYSGTLFLMRKVFSKSASLKILCYHRISDENFDPLFMNIKVMVFEEMIRHLKKEYNIISFEKSVDLLKSKDDIPENTVVITFDDGYRDNYINAFPILKKYQVPATIFITAGVINSGKMLWYDVIVDAFEKTNKTYVDLHYLNLGTYSLISKSDKLRATKEVAVSGKYLKRNEKEAFIKNILKELGVHPENNINSQSMLTWDDIKIMKDNGISFASHGMSHTILTTLSPEEAEFEITESKKMIEEKTGIAVHFFSYPNGGRKDFNEAIVQTLKKNNYTAACGLTRGGNDQNISLMELDRYCVTKCMIAGLSGRFSKKLFEVNIFLSEIKKYLK